MHVSAAPTDGCLLERTNADLIKRRESKIPLDVPTFKPTLIPSKFKPGNPISVCLCFLSVCAVCFDIYTHNAHNSSVPSLTY